MIDEVGAWLARLLFLLPNLMNLWEAAKGGKANQELEASLALVRAMKDRQMREELVQLGEPP